MILPQIRHKKSLSRTVIFDIIVDGTLPLITLNVFAIGFRKTGFLNATDHSSSGFKSRSIRVQVLWQILLSNYEFAEWI